MPRPIKRTRPQTSQFLPGLATVPPVTEIVIVKTNTLPRWHSFNLQGLHWYPTIQQIRTSSFGGVARRLPSHEDVKLRLSCPIFGCRETSTRCKRLFPTNISSPRPGDIGRCSNASGFITRALTSPLYPVDLLVGLHGFMHEFRDDSGKGKRLSRSYYGDSRSQHLQMEISTMTKALWACRGKDL